MSAIKKKLYRMFELPDNADESIPCVQLCSNISMTISECRKVLEYSDKRIVLSLSDNVITICGSGLMMKTFYGSVATVSGSISSVSYSEVE